MPGRLPILTRFLRPTDEASQSPRFKHDCKVADYPPHFVLTPDMRYKLGGIQCGVVRTITLRELDAAAIGQ